MNVRVRAETTDQMPKPEREGKTEDEENISSQSLGELAPLSEIEKEVVLKSFGEMVRGLVSNMKNLQCFPNAISLGVGR